MSQPVQSSLETGPPLTDEAARKYRFERFSTALLIDDMFFRADGQCSGSAHVGTSPCRRV